KIQITGPLFLLTLRSAKGYAKYLDKLFTAQANASDHLRVYRRSIVELEERSSGYSCGLFNFGQRAYFSTRANRSESYMKSNNQHIIQLCTKLQNACLRMIHFINK